MAIWFTVLIGTTLAAVKYADNICFDIFAYILIFLVSIDKNLFEKLKITNAFLFFRVIITSFFYGGCLALVVCLITNGLIQQNTIIHHISCDYVMFQIVVAVAEEIAIRYRLYSFLLIKFDNKKAIILNAIFFSLWHFVIHFSIYQVLCAFIFTLAVFLYPSVIITIGYIQQLLLISLMT